MVQQSLTNPRVLEALRQVMENPNATEQYADDAEIGPVLMQVNQILQSMASDDEE